MVISLDQRRIELEYLDNVLQTLLRMLIWSTKQLLSDRYQLVSLSTPAIK